MPRVYVRTPRTNIAAVLKHGVYGFVRRSEAAAVQLDDYFVLYGRGSAKGRKTEYHVLAIVKVCSGPFEDRTAIYPEGGVYPYRVKVVPTKLFEPGKQPQLDQDTRAEFMAAAAEVWPDFSRPSWANFQRFNQPLPAVIGSKLLAWLQGEPGIEDDEALEAYIDALEAPVIAAPPMVTSPDEVPAKQANVDEQLDTEDIREHIRVQWMLAQIAAKAELDVWIARNDHKTMAPDGKPLGECSLISFPDIPLPADALKPAKLIDVLWIDAERIPAAFEVEYTTNVTDGLLRLSDLAFAMGSSTVRLCIVAPQQRYEKVKSEIQRPSFRVAFDPKRERHCYFLSFENLKKVCESITGLPEAVHIQAPRLEDIAIDLLKG